MTTTKESDRHTAHLAALLALPGMGPHRLAVVIEAAGGAAEAWRAISGRPEPDRAGRAAIERADLRGRADRLLTSWVSASAGLDPDTLLAEHRAAGVELIARDAAGYPTRLNARGDPRLLFCRGDLAALDAPTVAIVGTRRATPYGLRVARQWGRVLAEAGVAVVSGLARGIDAAAHQGAIDAHGGDVRHPGVAGPVAVVGTGLDVVYPTSSRRLWQQVGELGLLVSEAPLGAGAERWRFPSRNRIIAGLADVTVVVESQAHGGSLSTAADALERDRALLAVPGSVFAPTSVGTHALLRAGCAVAADVSDVLDAVLGVGRQRASPRPALVAVPSPTAEHCEGTAAARVGDSEERVVLLAIGWEPAVLDDIVDRTGWSLGTTCSVLERLIRDGLVRQNGPWFTQEGE